LKLQNKYKIALVGYRLSGGGSDKVMVNLSLFLEKNGVEVYIVTVLDEGNVHFGGTYFSTNKLKRGNGVWGRITRLIGLRNFFKEHSFDFIIDFRFRTKSVQEFIISNFVYNAPTIFTIHSWATNHYIPDNAIVAKSIYNNSYALVCVSNAIKEVLYKKYAFKQLQTIYNSFIGDEFSNLSKNFESNTILFVGQLENETKQLDHLLEAFKISKLYENGIVIKVCGSGRLEARYKALVANLGLSENVLFIGFKQPPYQEMSQAKFLVLCSAYEGFPNVVIEALNCHLPVVSYNLKSGPSEVIVHEENGLLVENQNIDALANALPVFFTNDALYFKCKNNAKQSVQQFELEEIGKNWVQLLKLS